MAFTSCSDDPGSDEVTAAVELIVADQSASADAFVELVDAVARDGITADEAAEVARHLEAHLDTIGDSATDGGPIARHDAVRFFAALIDHGQTDRVAHALASWSVGFMAPAIEADAPESRIQAAGAPTVSVFAAAIAGERQTDDLRGRLDARFQFHRRVRLAEVAADAHGLEPPEPSEQALFLIRHNVNISVHFILAARDLDDSLSVDAPWPGTTA